MVEQYSLLGGGDNSDLGFFIRINVNEIFI